jgi:dCMP deaminase
MTAHPRVDWNHYFMAIAAQVATRSTCDRKHVGAAIVRDKMILATGYNGSLRGLEHCDDVGHLMQDGHCVRTVHAEANAIVQAARSGVGIDGAHIYVTASPCFSCFKLIANAGIVRVVFGEFYRDERIFSLAEQLHMTLVHLPAAELEPSIAIERDRGEA